jgi:hypothetical protein
MKGKKQYSMNQEEIKGEIKLIPVEYDNNEDDGKTPTSPRANSG